MIKKALGLSTCLLAEYLIVSSAGFPIKDLGNKENKRDSNGAATEHLLTQTDASLIESHLASLDFKPQKSCQCTKKNLEELLAPFNGPDPPFLPADSGGEAQIITLSDKLTQSEDCRLADGTSMCGRIIFDLTEMETHEDDTKGRQKSLTLDALTNRLILHAKKDDPTGLHKAQLTAYLQSNKAVFQTVMIKYTVNPAPSQEQKLLKQGEETRQSRRLALGYCTNPTTMLNLFNTGAKAEQSSATPGSSSMPEAGCDGELIKMNTSTYVWDPAKMIEAERTCVSSVGEISFWKVTLAASTSIQTSLIINRDDSDVGRFLQYIVTVGGNDIDVTLNSVCVAFGRMTNGGWYKCPTSLTGTTFGVYSTITNVNLMEAMAYTQEAIQMNVGVSVAFQGSENPSFPASNALQNIVVLLYTSTEQKCVLIQPPASGYTQLYFTLVAQTFINAIIMLGGYQTTGPPTQPQDKVEIKGITRLGTQQQCGGGLTNYYPNYSEVSCKILVNKVIITQTTYGAPLFFCGFGMLSDCDCAKSSLDPLQFTTLPAQFASAKQFTDIAPAMSITFNTYVPDTVSSVCGNADGHSKCGVRAAVQFKDKTLAAGQTINTWPYKGYSWDGTRLTFDFSQNLRDPITAFTSLVDYPTVTLSQDITVAPAPGSGPCLNQPGMLNLFNTGVPAEASSFSAASAGCDGDLRHMGSSAYKATPGSLEFWKITFPSALKIKSLLIINRDDLVAAVPPADPYELIKTISQYTVTIGVNPDVSRNEACKEPGFQKSLTDGSWILCEKEGTTVGIFTTTTFLDFMEAMAYSQEAIQLKSYSSFPKSYILGTPDPNYPVSNIREKIVVLMYTDMARQKCVVISAPSPLELATFIIEFEAEIPIDGVTLLAGYTTLTSDWPGVQRNVRIYARSKGGVLHDCGLFADYYAQYSEVQCNFQANRIIVEQQTPGADLRFCGFGALASCNCDQTSFDPALFTSPQVPLVALTSTPSIWITPLALTVTSPPVSITVKNWAPNTVQSVCSNTWCSTKLTFEDKLRGLIISLWPYRGFSYDAVTQILTVDPAQADSSSVITVTYSLWSYPHIKYSIDITATVASGLTIPQTPIAPATQAISNTGVKITWAAPADGGDPITAYAVAIKKSDGTYSEDLVSCDGSNAGILDAKSCTIPIQSLRSAPFNLDWGTSIYATVQATNGVGKSAVSPAGNGAVIITNPDAPLRLAIDAAQSSMTFVTLNWSNEASNGGSAVIEYLLFWGLEGNFTLLASGVTKTSYTTSVALTNKALKFRCQARNQFGLSSYSNEVQVIKKGPFTLRAEIGEQALLELPDINAEYTIRGNKTFKPEVKGNLLKVMSANLQDEGTKTTLQMTASSMTGLTFFKVDVIFPIKASNATDQKNETATTEVPEQVDASDLQALIKVITCNDDENGVVSCVKKATGQLYYFDLANGQLMQGTYANTSFIQQPTLKISQVNNKGQFSIEFSESMNLKPLANYTWDGTRSLQQKYLLGAEHLNLTINSTNEVPPLFEWYASNITLNTIVIQLVFIDPTKISMRIGEQDKLLITVLPSALQFFKSNATGALAKYPIKTRIRNLPPQVVPETLIENVVVAGEIIATTAKATTAANIALNVVLSGSLALMWPMEYAFQIIVSFNQQNLPLPGNVSTVISYLNDLSKFAVLKTEAILEYCFNFTNTESAGIGFESLGNHSKRLILILGSSFINMVLALVLYLLYGLVILLKRFHPAFGWIEAKIREKFKLKWCYIFALTIVDYYEVAIAAMLSFEQPEFKTPSDIFDFSFTVILTPAIFAMPFLNFAFLYRNMNELDKKEFKELYGSLYNGFATHTAIQREACVYVSSWFLLRRLLAAINLVYVRNQFIYLQLVFSMMLCFIDMMIKINLHPFKGGAGKAYIMYFNDATVLVLSYYMFGFTDYTLSAADKYQIGWVYILIVCNLVVSNMSVIVYYGSRDGLKKVTQFYKTCKEQKRLKKQPEAITNAVEAAKAASEVDESSYGDDEEDNDAELIDVKAKQTETGQQQAIREAEVARLPRGELEPIQEIEDEENDESMLAAVEPQLMVQENTQVKNDGIRRENLVTQANRLSKAYGVDKKVLIASSSKRHIPQNIQAKQIDLAALRNRRFINKLTAMKLSLTKESKK